MSVSSVPVLLVDDEPDVLLTQSMVLREIGYVVVTAAEAAQALRLAARIDFHVALVDYRLAGSPMDGLELIARLRHAHPLTVSLLMTVYNKGAIGFRASQAGAFDFLAKPFSTKALLATVHTALAERRRRERTCDHLTIGDLVVNKAIRRVDIAGEPVSLSDQEFDLLTYLVTHSYRIVGYKELWEMVWGYNSLPDKRVIHKAISRLREKAGKKRIACVRKKGYRLMKRPSH